MPPKGGKRTKRAKKPTNEPINKFTPFAKKEDDQSYAIVTKMLGNRRMTGRCADGRERLLLIPGKFKGKRNWIETGMLLMINLRNFQDEKADVIYIYNTRDRKLLQKKGELVGLVDEEDCGDCVFEFGNSDSDSDSNRSPTAEEEELNDILDDL